jgi:hypothetical protein
VFRIRPHPKLFWLKDLDPKLLILNQAPDPDHPLLTPYLWNKILQFDKK